MSEIITQNSSGKRVIYWLIIAFAIFSAYRLGVSQGSYTSIGSSKFSLNSFFGGEEVLSPQDRADLSLFWRSWDLLKDRYVENDTLDEKKMVEGAIRGMMASADDPYTTFLNMDENAELESDIAGTFEGIGAEIGIRDQLLTIVAPLADSPAEQAGLRSGDKIIKINDEETLKMGLEEAARKMRGKKGTDVTFTIFREGEKETRLITVTRDRIDIESVTAEYRSDGIAYVALTRFGEDTARDFQKISQNILDHNSKGIILDMRNNPGGLLSTAVDLAGSFLEKGSVVVSEEYGNGKKDIDKTNGVGALRNIPVVILINEGSASASEILAGALKDNRDDITLVGKKSFGKGSVQELVPLPRGSAVKITVAKWFTPSGKGIDHDGILPDIEVEITDEDFEADRDPQLDKAIDLLHSSALN